MSSGQTYRDRGGGDRDAGYRSNYNARGGNFRGRGGNPGYKPRRYWDVDDFYKDEREKGGRGRRRRSYSRSRSRSRSYSSRSRSRSRTPPPRRGRSRSPPPRQPEEYVPRTTQEHPSAAALVGHTPEPYEPYVPSKDPANTWTGSRIPAQQEYVPQANGQTAVVLSQMNPYGNVDAQPGVYPHYQETSVALTMSEQAPVGYSYGHVSHSQYHQQQIPEAFHQLPAVGQVLSAVPPPPAISGSKPSKEESNDGSKKKKDKRKKKKRHHSSSSSSSSSDDSSESRRRRKSKKGRGAEASSDSSSDEDKKDKSATSGLTTQQKEALLKQREGYQTKLEILEREIGKLQNKEDELLRNRADRQLIDENLKLQAELKGRCKAVIIVLEKIDDVLKVGNKTSGDKTKPAMVQPSASAPPPPHKITQMLPDSDQKNINQASKKGGIAAFDYFDNGLHWCRLCNVFPETVQEMLSHFHSKDHHDQIQQLGIDEKPWHKRNSITEAKPLSGARKAPFRGMQFFSPVEGWYCRLCNSWMGDPHCAVEHLKSDDHNSNYMNFLEEHPDWEQKWVSDRDRALQISGKQDPPVVKKSRFDDSRQPERKFSAQDDLESGKSIRVQMRNSLRGEEKEDLSKFTAALSEAPVSNKDSGLEEWMGKPKVTVDIIDTQKFAAIVRQKHGAKEKELREIKNQSPEKKLTPPPPPLASMKDRDRDAKKEDRRRTDKVEMQISSRDRDRDRYRDREARNSRRRSRSRSRSRSRERRYGRRRSRSRSRSRSRDRSDRDRRDRNERDRPDFKEAVKKLPMIGKMPLYKRPVFTKEKPEIEDKKQPDVPPPVLIPPVGFLPVKDTVNREDPKIPMYGGNSMSTPYNYQAHPSYQDERYGQPSMTTSVYAEETSNTDGVGAQVVSAELHPTEVADDVPTEDVKPGDKEGTPAALPDDFQQALDIIYSVGSTQQSVPQPVPPPVAAPSTNGAAEEQPVAGSVDYNDYNSMGSNGYPSYMGYQPYQQSFDGYAPVGYEELDDGPPGVGDGRSSAVGAVKAPPTVTSGVDSHRSDDTVEKDPPPPGDDDMEDLRMLGIDVDDTAVVLKH